MLYNEGFRFYITTRDEKPEYMPDVSMWITLIDFDLTTEGLNQVIRHTSVHERKDFCDVERDELIDAGMITCMHYFRISA